MAVSGSDSRHASVTLVSQWRRAVLFVAVAFIGSLLLSGCADMEPTDDEEAYVAASGDNASDDEDGGGSELGDLQPAPEADGAGLAGATPSSLEPVYFPFDSSVLQREALESLKRNATYLRDNPRTTLQVEGHCDDRGTVEYNLALGERRANATRKYLEKLGIEGARITTVSYGEERPLAQGSGESIWGKNRRAEFVVTSSP